jgi:orotidine-5'-phosphate decarboxylase
VQHVKNANDYIIFPLDLPTIGEASKYVGMLSGHVGLFKVGLELFINAGPKIVEMVQASGPSKVFLDLKLYDIPETVRRAMAAVAKLDVFFATVHSNESREMLRAAVRGAQGKVGVLAVTVLTSLGEDELKRAGYKQAFYGDLKQLVKKRVGWAKAAGCSGVVCSGFEVPLVKEIGGDDFLAVTPGIRPVWEGMSADDQKRVMTPAKAIENGADYLVIGRPIRDAANPVDAAKQIGREIEVGLSKRALG